MDTQTQFNIGDKVVVTHRGFQNLYGVKPQDEFEVVDSTDDFVKLSNGLQIAHRHLELVVPPQSQLESENEIENDDDDSFNLHEAVCDVLEVLQEDELAFTAYDITKELRFIYPGENIPHKEVRLIVRDMFEAGEFSDEYDAQTIDVGKPGDPPWLYYPEGYNPLDYKPNLGPQAKPESDHEPGDMVATPTSTPGKNQLLFNKVKNFITKFKVKV